MIRRIKRVRNITWIRLGLGIGILSTFLFFIPYSTIYHWFSIENVIAWVQSARSNTWTLFLFYLLFTLGVMALPITLFPIVGGVLFDLQIALPMNLVAATTGAWFSFLISRFFGRETVEAFLRGKLKSFDKYTANQGLKTVFLLRWVGFPPFIVANYALGLSGIRNRDYLVGTFFGILPWMAIVTYGSTSLWQALLMGGKEGLRNALFGLLGPIMLLSSMTLLVVGINLYLKNKRAKNKTK